MKFIQTNVKKYVHTKKCFRDFTYCKIGDFLNLTIRSLRACVCAHIVEGQHF